MKTFYVREFAVVAVASLSFVTILPAQTPPPFAPDSDTVITYTGCAVIDGSGGPLRRDMAIITRGERIEAIVPAADLQPPARAEVVDVKGKFALPGFINSHEHLATPPDRRFAEAMMRRDIYSGVTAVRAMGDDIRAVAEYARASRVGEIAGPDIYYAALFAGPDFLQDPRLLASSQGFKPGTAPWMQAIDDQTDLATAVTLAKGTSAVAIKIYANLSAALVAKIAAEAHRQGMLVWAHGMVFPATPQEVIDAKPDTMSHTGYLAYHALEKRPKRYQERESFPIDPAPFQNGDNKVMAALFDQMRDRGIILDATNYVFETIERMRAQTPDNAPPPPYCSSRLAELLCAQAYKHHVAISAGTDSFAPADDPYSALQSEMEILVHKVGMTPMDAIRSATIISATSAGQQKEMGTLEPGKLANIVFLSADPLQDISAVRNVELTVKRGVRFPRKDYRPVSKEEVEGRL
ncbi:MAG: amidohydrolase family protein [Chthoniobacterales bacterium]